MSGLSGYKWTCHPLSPLVLNEFLSTHSALWPQWNWREMIEAGITARDHQDPLEVAIERVREKFDLSGKSRILLAAWVSVGLVTKC